MIYNVPEADVIKEFKMINITKAIYCALLVCLLIPGMAAAQSARTENTFKLDDDTKRPPASIEQVSWLVGDWTGTAFGKQFEEVWNPVSAGTMIGFFKLFSEDEIEFYELLLLEEEEGSLSLKVKHFSKAFHAWEDKEDYVNFKLVKIEPDAIHFSGLSFYRDGDDKITAYIAFKNSDGSVREEQLLYQRR